MGKLTLFDESTRVPLIVRAPDCLRSGVSTRLVELVDLYPTLVDLCHLPMVDGLEGVSFQPLLQNPSLPWKKAAFTVVTRDGGVLGRAVHTEQYRYTHWGDANTAELYDLVEDPHEYKNLILDKKHQAVIADMQKLLVEGWQKATPQSAQLAGNVPSNEQATNSLTNQPARSKVESPESADGRRSNRVLRALKDADKNNDNKLTLEEFPQPEIFQDVDRDGDGFATLEEVRSFLTSRAGAARTNQRADSNPAPATVTDPAAAETVKVVKTLDVRYADVPDGVDPNHLSLDLYAPQNAKNLPVMIYIHGGGWWQGDKRGVGVKPDYFASRGYVFVSLNYRFVPAVDILTQLQDSANAVAWVHSQIDKHGGDPARLHLIGHSAGAHHVAVLGTNERFLKAAGKELSILRSVVELDTQALDVPTLMGGRENATYTQAFGNDPAVWTQVSPLNHVGPDKGVPPFFLVVADERAPKLTQAAAFQNALQAVGVRCEFVEAPQHDHGSLNRAIGDPEDQVTQAMQAFHRSLVQTDHDNAVPSSPPGPPLFPEPPKPAPAPAAGRVSQRANALRQLDTDHDGKLSREEAAKSPRAIPFAEFDTNGDGFISPDEAATALRNRRQNGPQE
jgi:acetyl esterase/lipase